MNNLFYNFDQNNSGGYFVKNKEHGIREHIIIEAANAAQAWERLQGIEDFVPDLFIYCSCCGERWSNYNDDNDGTTVPLVYDTPVNEYKQSAFMEGCFIHYLDGTIKEVIFKSND